MKLRYLVAAAWLMCGSLSAQVSMTGDLTAHIDSIISTIPNETPANLYVEPTSTQRSTWRQIIDNILSGSYSTAHSTAGTLSYRLVAFSDNSASPAKLYYVLEKTAAGSNHWGTYVFNPAPRRPKLVIQSPHPIDNINTGEQGWRVFMVSQALAYFVPSACKCNSTSFSPCDGTTTACSGSSYESYRLSDQAHVVNGPFQLTTERILSVVPDMIAIQLHGYTPGTGDPDIIMSNGTTVAPSGTDPIPTLRDHLLGQDASLTFKIPHIDSWTYMAGQDNTQGRLLNGVTNPCGNAATSSTGQFIHIEQRYSKLRNTEANWYKMANAVALTFPAAGQITTAQSGSWGAAATWTGGLIPSAADDVFISAGHTISVDDAYAECHSISFGGEDAHLDMNSSSELSIYGDFTLYSTTHNVFSAGWSSSQAYVRFAGVANQMISGFNLTEGSTSFRDVIVDKSAGKVTTSGLGMVLGIQNSLNIVSGTFELAAGDDLESRWSSSALRTLNQDLTITVAANGKILLTDGDGSHFIRSGENSQPIGKMTLYGEAQFYDAGPLDISIDDIDVKSGGQLELGTGLYTEADGPQFNPGTVTVASGGEIYSLTTSDVWFDTSIVVLNAGGTFSTVSETTILPPNFTNNGRIRYQRDPTTVLTDQVVVDTNYYRLEASFNGGATKKLWTLASNRTVSDSLTINNDAELVISADAARKVTVGGTLRLTSGSIDISDPDVTLEIANGAAISRATATISNAPTFAGSVDVRYTSTTTSVATGPELPTGSSILGALTIYCTDQTVTLSEDATVNDTLNLSQGTFDIDGATLFLANGLWLRRATAQLSRVPEFGSTVNLEYISTVSAVNTSYELPTSPTVLNNLKITSDRGVTLAANAQVNGALTVTGSNLNTDGYRVTLGSSATISETSGYGVRGTAVATRTVSQAVNNTFGGLGVEINAAGAAPGVTTVTRVTGTTPTIPSVYAISRYFDISPAINTGLNATFVFHYADNELAGLDENTLTLYSSADGGSTWTPRGGTVNTTANTITVTGVGSFSRWSAGGSLLDMVLSAQSGPWSSASTWTGGVVPTSTDDVMILSGHTISVDDQTAECLSLSFGGEDSHIQMNDYSRLDIYGNFTLFSGTHNVFSAGWSTNSAFVRFTGAAATQTLYGFSSTGASTSFRDVIIDKSAGTVKTAGGGEAGGQRIGFEHSLEIINGTFSLSVGDDIEARFAVSGERTENQDLSITIQTGGNFELVDGDGTHFIRSGLDSAPIGRMTVFGEARFYDASSYDISIGGIDIKAGGTVRLQSSLGTTTYGPEFNPGTITIDSGGVLYHNSTVNLWFDTTVVVLNNGGQYQLASSSVIFPPTLVNNGKVRWQRNPTSTTTDQVVIDTSYYDVEFAYNGSNTKKIWTLYADRPVADSFIVSNEATVNLSSGDAAVHKVNVGQVLRLTTGTINNSATATIALADGATISRARGTIALAPTFLGKANVRYTSSLESVTTGPELPTSSTILQDLTIYCSGQTVTLGSDATVNGNLTLSLGTFDNNGADDDYNLRLANGATIRRAQGVFKDEAPVLAGNVNVEYISTELPVTTGLELPTSPTALRDLIITGDKGVTLGANVTVNGNLLVSDSNLITGTYTATLASGATITETSGFAVEGRVQTTRTAAMGVNQTFGGLGIEINAAGAAPGSTTVLRVTGTAQTVSGNPGIKRYFDITPTVNAGLNATIVFHYQETELNGLTESSLGLYSSTDGGTTWTSRGGVVDITANTVTLTGVAGMSRWTLGTVVSTGCCVGKIGDVNNSGGDGIPTISDVSMLIDALFITGNCSKIVCIAEADANQSGGADPICASLTISDISTLIDYLFITGPSKILPDCK
jgi:hypothetical protein